MDKVLEAILRYGLLPTFLLVIIFLIVQDPNRAIQLKSFVLAPFFRFFNWFKRVYVANEISKHLNIFFSKELPNQSLNFKISWVKSEESPILKSGRLVIRMKREEDQARNILSATKYALPKIICPIFRYNISPVYATAIDFTFLHKLAEKLGNHGKAVYRKYFLNPEVESNTELIETLQKLIKLDKFGVFTTILINELDNVGEGLYADSDTKDRTSELIQLINYLCTIAEREIGEYLGERLNNFSEVIKVSIIMLAKSQTANRKGLIPYLRRLNINLEKGSESIYIIAFPPAFDFLNKFIKVIDGNQRVSIDKIFKAKDISYLNEKISISICCLRKNKLFTNDSFIKKLEASEIKVGRIVEGTVIDCSTEEALVTFLGVDATIRKSDCSWFSHLFCTDMLQVGDVKQFLVKSIDKANGNITLSLKLSENDPWMKIEFPKIDDEIEIHIHAKDNLNYKCGYQNLVEVFIPIEEMSWFNFTEGEKSECIGSTIKAKVITVNENERIIKCSPRQLEINPWPIIHDTLKVGTEMNGKVHEITDYFVRVKIDNGLIGKIQKESLVAAGFEYANYKDNMVVGQGIDVVVTKVFINKRWIRLDLKRNLN